MGPKGVAADALARHLHAAIQRVRQDVEIHATIERVREDVAKVEFWADAMTGFSKPIPDYGDDDVKVWMPPEQATRISSSARKTGALHKQSKKRR